MVKYSALIILVSVLSIPLRGQNFKSIKVGMTDKQVESLLGLPKEIRRGFTELKDFGKSFDDENSDARYNIETSGQLIYVCWIYNDRKQTALDTLDEYYDKEDTTGFTIDTLYYRGDNQCSHFDYERADNSVRRFEVRRNALIDVEHIFVKRTQRLLVSNLCVLFETASNRVASIDYYPIAFMKKNCRIKK